MAMLVGKEWCSPEVVLVLWVLVAWLRTGPRRWGKCRDLGLILRFRKLPSVLLVLSFRASRFLPNRLDRR